MKRAKHINKALGISVICFWIADILWRSTMSAQEFAALSFKVLARQISSSMTFRGSVQIIGVFIDIAIAIALTRMVIYLILHWKKAITRDKAVPNIKNQLLLLWLSYLIDRNFLVWTFYSPITNIIIRTTGFYILPFLIPLSVNPIGAMLSYGKALLLIGFIITVPPIKSEKAKFKLNHHLIGQLKAAFKKQ